MENNLWVNGGMESNNYILTLRIANYIIVYQTLHYFVRIKYTIILVRMLVTSNLSTHSVLNTPFIRINS
jgi:hypothetical protein